MVVVMVLLLPRLLTLEHTQLIPLIPPVSDLKQSNYVGFGYLFVLDVSGGRRGGCQPVFDIMCEYEFC